jgi:toxin CptA
MHSAPSVTYPVGRCHFEALLMAAAWLAGAASLAAWIVHAPGASWRPLLAAALLAATAAVAIRHWRGAAEGQLAWNGEAWHLDAAGGSSPGRVEAVLDLQNRLLVRWLPAEAGERARAWSWLERKRAPAHWDALRRTVYSPARTDAPPGGAAAFGAPAPRRPT